MKVLHSLALAAMIASTCIGADVSVRERVCLNGMWEFSPGDVKQETLAPSATFVRIPVPSFWDQLEQFDIAATWSKELTRGWYRRSFDVNAAWVDRRVVLHFDAVRYVSEVFVNGRKVGGGVDGFLPFDVDVTDAVKLGQANQLTVKVTNWRGLLHPSAKDVQMPFNAVIRDADAFLAPAGVPPRMGNQAGIWQDVWLEALPKCRIECVKIETSVAKQTLSVRAMLIGGEDAKTLKIVHDVLDGEKTVLTLNNVAGEKAIETTWREAKLWWPHDPQLYTLRSRLVDADGKIVDEVVTRFGFREITWDKRYVYINGERLNLRGDNYMQLGDPAGIAAFRKEYVKALFEVMKKCNINVVRLHGNPSPSSTLDAADEVGMLILDESATYGSESHFRVNSAVFQKNNTDHVHRLVMRDWNHPSVIAYSLSNEFGCPEAYRHALYTSVKSLDGTRIVYDEAITGADADVWSSHYTWDWTRNGQLPNTAYWLGDAAWVKRTFGVAPEQIDKPIFISEYYAVDMTSSAMGTSVFLGLHDRSASKVEKSRLHFYVLRYVAEGIRYTNTAQMGPFCLLQHFWAFCSSGVTLKWPSVDGPGVKPTRTGALMANPGWSGEPPFPWTPDHQNVQFAYHPMYAFSPQYAHTFWADTNVKRRIVCFNDDLRKLAKRVRWTAKVGEAVVAKGEHVIASRIGFYDEFEVEFALPKVASRTEGTLALAVDVDKTEVFTNPLPLVVFPKPASVAEGAGAVGMLCLSEAERAALATMGVKGRIVNTAAEMQGVRTIVVGPSVAEAMTSAELFPALAKFVEAGGRVIAIQQPNMWWLPGRLPMDGDSWSTIAFSAGEHPIVAGLKDDDLRFWGEDHTVARGSLMLNELPKSATGVIVAGSPMGLAYAPLVEYRYGRGMYVLCQMAVLKKCSEEAAAGVLLANMLTYAQNVKIESAASAEPFVYRRLWQSDIDIKQVLPAVAPNRYYIDHVSQTYGSEHPVLSWMPKEGFGEWKISGIPANVGEVSIQLLVRQSGPNGYTLTINGKPVPMQAEYQHVRETFDSGQGWKIHVGSLDSLKTVKVRNGDRLRITCHQDWSAIVRVRLVGEYK